MSEKFSSRHIVDFYYLEAIMNKARRLPEVCKPSQERWCKDLEEVYHPFMKNFARAVRDYLLMICIGEARHGSTEGPGYFTSIPMGESRHSVYRKSSDFSTHEVKRLASLFDLMGWTSGYGGPAWGKIVRALELYDFLPPDVFIDLVISIEHNCGNVFNKMEVRQYMPFECDMDLYYHDCEQPLKRFLNFKARMDILTQTPPKWFVPLSRVLTYEVMSLLERYYVVVARSEAIPKWIRYTNWGERVGPKNFLPKSYDFEWGNGSFGKLVITHVEEDREEYEDYVEATKEVCTPRD